MNKWSFVVFFVLSVVTHGPLIGAPGEIKTGKWSGYLQISGSSDAIAVTLDSFVVRPNPIEDFQILKLLFKYNLGGYASSEYETELFEDPPYDWDQNILVLDNSDNQLVGRLTIQKAVKPIMEGTVSIRSAVPPVSGFLHLQFRSDGPVDFLETTKLAPSLSGQYEGRCGANDAVLQVETGKGLTTEIPIPTVGLHHYQITGGLGISNPLCLDRWCLNRAYSAGNYDFFQRRLYLTGSRHNDQCNRDGEEFSCPIPIGFSTPGVSEPGESRHGMSEKDCKFKKVNPNTNARIKVYPKLNTLSPTTEELLPLPKKKSPLNQDLVAALNGSFFGYLHHEYRDRYQPIVLGVAATTSSINPHKQNNVFISVTAVPFFGQKVEGQTISYPFDRRIAYFAPPGYLLESKESDVFLIVQEWRKGFVSGVWYSKFFGRVGTFEAIKGDSLPPLDSSAKRLADVSGRFQGPKDESAFAWQIKSQIPKQPKAFNTLVFQVEYGLFLQGGSFMGVRTKSASYDLYTGALSWGVRIQERDEMSLVTGFLNEPDHLSLFWPGARSWGVGFFDRELSDYPRTGGGE